jgi:hypothetical protein
MQGKGVQILRRALCLLPLHLLFNLLLVGAHMTEKGRERRSQLIAPSCLIRLNLTFLRASRG